MKTLPSVRLLALSSLLAAAAASQAGVLTNSVGTTGNQAFNNALGMSFNVGSTPLVVSGLGAFDSGQDGFAAGTTITVGIFDISSQALVGSSLTFTNASAGTLVGAWREKDLATPFTLAANRGYMIVAQGFNASDPNLNTGIAPYTLGQSAATNSAASLLTFTGVSYNSSASGFVYPTNSDTGPSIRFGAGNFTLAAAPVPEPAPLAALGLGALGLLRRRRKA